MPVSYIICATPRTGSTLLCDLLSATGITGQPDSFYSSQFTGEWAAHWGVEDPSKKDTPARHRAYLDAAIAAGKGPSDVFGMRLMKEHVTELSRILGQIFHEATSDLEKLERAFGPTAFIHLFRRDKVAQAVSRLKAEQSGLWHMAPDGSELERLTPPQPLRYDAERIAAHLAQIEAYDREWADWFTAQNISPHRITYETLSDDPSAALSGVLGRLGLVSSAAKDIKPRTAKLSDTISTEWIARYRQETG